MLLFRIFFKHSIHIYRQHYRQKVHILYNHYYGILLFLSGDKKIKNNNETYKLNSRF